MVFSGDQQGNSNMNSNFNLLYQTQPGSVNNNMKQQHHVVVSTKSPTSYLPGSATLQCNSNFNIDNNNMTSTDRYLYQIQQQQQQQQQQQMRPIEFPISSSSSSSEDLSEPSFNMNNFNNYHHPSTDSLCGSSSAEFIDESEFLQMHGISNRDDQQTQQKVITDRHQSSSLAPKVIQNNGSIDAFTQQQPFVNAQQQTQQQYQQQLPPQYYPIKQKIKKAILYIDLDNFPISKPNEYLEMLAKIKSKYSIDVTAKKIFGDLNQFEKLPVDFQFSHQLIICPKVSSRKNTTDIALTIEVIKDLERKKPFEVFIIASSDSDFVPVVKAIRDEGKECWILPSHNCPHQTLMSICNGILDFNSQQNVSNPLQELNIPSSQGVGATNKTSQSTSPRKKEIPTPHIKTNHIPPSQNMLSISEVKNLISKIIRKLEFSGVKTFNLSYVHEQLRDKSILYNHYGYMTFRSLFEEWSKENPKFKFERNDKNGQLSFVQEIHPSILHRPQPISVPQPSVSQSSYNTITNNPSTRLSPKANNEGEQLLSKPKGNKKALKNAITTILKNLYNSNSKGSFNMSFVNERMRERGLKYKDHGYDSMKTLFSEWKQEHPTALLGVRERSGELFFAPGFSL